MPYTPKARRTEVRTERKRANSDGDYNFMYSVEYLEEFIAAPSYATIAKIKKSVIKPSKVERVGALDDFLTVMGVPELDRRTARELAWEEFYRRIGVKYEDECIVKNGDLEEYQRAFDAIRKKFQKEVE